MSAEALRAMIARDAELSEILMRAFILRRLALISHNLGNVILMGSRHSAETLQLREFLGRNGHPHTYVDPDTDKTSQESGYDRRDENSCNAVSISYEPATTLISRSLYTRSATTWKDKVDAVTRLAP